MSVPAGAGNEVVAGPVPWTPGAAEPQHCCLFATLNTGDDYHEGTTLDPIVWPFDIARDNNMIWKNMWIEEVPPSPDPSGTGAGEGSGQGPAKGKSLTFVAKNPYTRPATIEVNVRVHEIAGEEVLRIGFSAEALRRSGGPVLKDLEPVKETAARPERRLEQQPEQRRPLGRLLAARPKPKLAVDFKPEAGWRNLGGTAHDKGVVLSLGRVAPGKGGRINLNVAAIAGAKPGDIHRIDFEQRTGGQVTGGGTYVVIVKE